MPYAPWHDEHARVFDLAPGQILSWPLNAPHRVENIEGVNISMTVSFSSPAIRRREILHLANGLLRHRFGVQSPGRRIEGPGFLAKAVLQKLMRDSAWVRRQRQAAARHYLRLDPAEARRDHRADGCRMSITQNRRMAAARPSRPLSRPRCGRLDGGRLATAAREPRPCFQRPEWLEPFYAALARHQPDMQPLTVEVADAQGALAYRLALLMRRIGSRRIIEFADLNMTDFNAPLLGPGARQQRQEAARAWKAVKRALPPCDARCASPRCRP